MIDLTIWRKNTYNISNFWMFYGCFSHKGTMECIAEINQHISNDNITTFIHFNIDNQY